MVSVSIYLSLSISLFLFLFLSLSAVRELTGGEGVDVIYDPGT